MSDDRLGTRLSCRYSWNRPDIRVSLGLAMLCAALAIRSVPATPPDSRLPLHVNPVAFALNLSLAWDPSEDLGRRSGLTFAYAPVAWFYAGLRAFGLSSLSAHRAFVTLVLALAALSMYWLLSALWPRNLSRAARAILSLLYALNPYVSLNLAGTAVLLLPYSVVPLVGLLLARGIELRSPPRLVAGAAIWAVVAPGINPTANIIAVVGVLGVALAVVAQKGLSRVGAVWPLIAIALLGTASVWWIGPFLASLRESGADSYLLTDPIEVGGSRSSFREVFRLTGLWALYVGYNGTPYYASQPWLLHRFVVAATIGVPFAALVGMWRAWSRRPTRVAAGLLAISVPMAVSIYPPSDPSATGHVYRWLHDNFFAFQAFRSNYKWVSIVALALVLLGAASQISLPTKSGSRFAAVTLATLTVGVFAFVAPFTSQTVLAREFRIGTIPDYWEAAGSWLDEQSGGGRVLLTPHQGYSVYSWGRPLGNIAPLVTKRPVVEDRIAIGTNAEGRELVGLTTRAVSDSSIDFVKVLQLLDVRWVLQRNDVDWAFYSSPSPAQMRAFLEQQPRLSLVRSFGMLDVYEVAQSGSARLQEASNLLDIATDGGLPTALAAYTDGTLARFRHASQRINVISANASSSFGGTEDFAGKRAVDGDPATAWVPARNRGVGEILTVELPEARRLGRVEISARVNGLDTTPSMVAIEAAQERREVELDETGRGFTEFGDARAQEMTVQIKEVRSGGGDNVGLAEVSIQGAPAQELVLPKVGELENSAPRAVLNYEEDPLPARRVEVGETGFNRLELLAELDPETSDATLAAHLGLEGVKAIRASSRFGSRATSSPYFAFDGNKKTAWIVDSPNGTGEQVEVDFSGPRDIPSVALTSPASHPPVPVVIEVVVDGQPARISEVVGGAGARSEILVRRRGARLQLRVLHVGPHDDSFRVGFSEIEVPGLTRQEVPLAAPSLAINGAEVDLRLTGDDTVAGVLAGGSARFAANLQLQPGAHVITSARTPPWRLKRVELRGGASDDAALLRAVPARSAGDTVVAATRLRTTTGFVRLAESYDPLWKCLECERPRPIGPVNGYANAWSIRPSLSKPKFVFDQGPSVLAWALVGGFGFGALTLLAVVMSRNDPSRTARREGYMQEGAARTATPMSVEASLPRATRDADDVNSAPIGIPRHEGHSGRMWFAGPAVLVAASGGLVLLGLEPLSEDAARWAYYLLLVTGFSTAIGWARTGRGRDPKI